MKATSGHAWQSLKHSWEQQGRRCGPRNPTTFPFEERAPQQEAAAQHCRPHTGPSVLHRSVCRLLPYWAANTHNQENPGKRRHDHMLHLRSFSSQLFWYFAVGSKQLALSPISSWLSCSWSWHPWFLRSQPWRCRTRKHLAGVSNLLALTTLPSRYSANWTTTCPCSLCEETASRRCLQTLPISPTHQLTSRGEEFSWDLRFSPPNKEQGGRLSESSCYQLRLATGQTPLSNRKKDIRATQAIPVAFARSLLLKSTCRASKTRFSVLQRKRSHFICSHSSKSPLRKQAVFSQAKVCLSKCVHVS